MAPNLTWRQSPRVCRAALSDRFYPSPHTCPTPWHSPSGCSCPRAFAQTVPAVLFSMRFPPMTPSLFHPSLSLFCCALFFSQHVPASDRHFVYCLFYWPCEGEAQLHGRAGFYSVPFPAESSASGTMPSKQKVLYTLMNERVDYRSQQTHFLAGK